MGYAFQLLPMTPLPMAESGDDPLERAEFAFFGALGRVDFGTGGDGEWDADFDHLSLVMPFNLGGIQQTVGLAATADFDSSWFLKWNSVNIGAVARLDKDETATFKREGEFATLGMVMQLSQSPVFRSA